MSTSERMISVVAKEDPFLGSVLGNYRVVKRIGGGAYGEVYRAEHVRLGIPYAVKILHPAFTRQETALKRFWREAQTTSRLKHDNIVSVTDFDIDAQLGPYLIMELLEGETLGALMQREGALPMARVRSLAKPICGALHAAHELGVIHRDLKPDNIFLSKKQGGGEVVKVLDFGIARLTEGGEALTGVGQTLGTPEYMAPEQCRGLPLGAPADIYCFGVLLYQMLTGKLPFEGTDGHQFMMHHLITPPPSLDESFPLKLRSFLLQMLEKRPEGRPGSMAEVWEQLDQILPGKSQTLPEEKGLQDTDQFDDFDDGFEDAIREALRQSEQTSEHLRPDGLLEAGAPDASEPSIHNSGEVILLVKKTTVSPTMEMDMIPDLQAQTQTQLDAAGSSPYDDHTPPEFPAHGESAFDEPQTQELASISGSPWLLYRRCLLFEYQVADSEDFRSEVLPALKGGESFFPTEEPALNGDEIFFRFTLFSGEKIAEGRAEVLEVVLPGSKQTPGMGLSILEFETALPD